MNASLAITNIYRHYKNKWLSTHLITILEVCSRAGNDGVLHEILRVTMKHCCKRTITSNAVKINAQASTAQRFPCPRHLFIPPLLFVYIYTTVSENSIRHSCSAYCIQRLHTTQISAFETNN